MKLIAALALLMLAQTMVACDARRSSPTPFPSSVPQTSPQPSPPATPTLARFRDAATGFSTTDLYDAQEQIVQVTSTGDLIWAADDTRFGGYVVQGLYIVADALCGCWLEVRFGTREGERRAYLTADYGHDNPGTVVDLAVVEGRLLARRTEIYLPGTFTLSGFVMEASVGGAIPVEGLWASFPYGSGYRQGKTDARGFYEIRGVEPGRQDVTVGGAGYQLDRQTVTVVGDTTHDVRLIRAP